MDKVLTINHIVSDPEKHQGKPRIAGKGVTVQHLAALYRLGWTADELADDYELTQGEIHAALSYYFDHKAEIDAAIESAEKLAEQVGRPITELMRRLPSK